MDIIDKVLKERIKFMPGGRTLIATMKEWGLCRIGFGGSRPLQTRLRNPWI